MARRAPIEVQEWRDVRLERARREREVQNRAANGTKFFADSASVSLSWVIFANISFISTRSRKISYSTLGRNSFGDVVSRESLSNTWIVLAGESV